MYEHQNEENVLGDFDGGMDVSIRMAGLSMPETADLQGFSHTTLYRVYTE